MYDNILYCTILMFNTTVMILSTLNWGGVIRHKSYTAKSIQLNVADELNCHKMKLIKYGCVA